MSSSAAGQYDLFGGTPPHVALSDTSKAAAESMRDHVGPMQARILKLVRSVSDGLTCDQIEERTGLRHQSASARVRELYLKQRLRRDGKRVTRSGRMAHIYKTAKERR